MKVLIIEDNVQLSKNISEYLKIKWIKSETDFDGNRWYQKILENHRDVVILDINLPGKDWMEICKDIRSKWNNTAVLMLTSRNTTKDIIDWLNIWADDYLWKPFDLDELVSRVEALYRRTASNKTNIFNLDNIEVDLTKRIVTKSWEDISLSNLEFDLLKYLLLNRWRPVDRKTLFENVWWDFDAHMFSRSVDVYIWYLRKKLWDDLIETRKWFGYVIK